MWPPWVGTMDPRTDLPLAVVSCRNAQFSPEELWERAVMASHDEGYKLLFSHPRMVEDLLRGFVEGDWVQNLDFSTLEKASGHYVSEDLRERESDMVWRVRW